jgi:hypothetical protein
MLQVLKQGIVAERRLQRSIGRSDVAQGSHQRPTDDVNGFAPTAPGQESLPCRAVPEQDAARCLTAAPAASRAGVKSSFMVVVPAHAIFSVTFAGAPSHSATRVVLTTQSATGNRHDAPMHLFGPPAPLGGSSYAATCANAGQRRRTTTAGNVR